MTKYWSVFGLGLQNSLTYRANYLARALFGLIPLLAMLYLWRTIFEGQPGQGTTFGIYLPRHDWIRLPRQAVTQISLF